MGVYERGKIWWYEFEFRGLRIRESSYSNNKALAQRIERERRRSLELGTAGLKDTAKPLRFADAAKSYVTDREAHWASKTRELNRNSLAHLAPHFSKTLLLNLKGSDISRYQATRQKEGASARSINIEVGLVRQILRKHRRWADIQPDVHMLRERTDIGRALSPDEEHRILLTCKKSASRSLYPAVLLSLHTGLRKSELRLMKWRQVDLLTPIITVGTSKTAGGEGRIVPLSDDALQCLMDWRAQFPDALPSHFVFPSERYGLMGQEGTFGGEVRPYEVIPTVALKSWQTAWSTAKKAAGIECRWHDLRHSFVSRMAEGQATDTTITALAGWMSKKMMERYSHVRNEAKRAAIAVLNSPHQAGISPARSPQYPPQQNGRL